MELVAVTGPEVLPGAQADYAREVLRNEFIALRPHQVVSGAQYGVDTVAAEVAWSLGVPVDLIVPYAPFNVELVDKIRRHEEPGMIHYCPEPPDGRRGTAYMIRNDHVVESGTRLTALPLTREERLRSGTWATIRRALKARKPVTFYPLDQSPPWTVY